jgi:hypothetical protein
MSIRVCLQDFYEMVVPPCRNMKPVWDLPLWGSLKYQSSA